jgi:PPOX class probable FMN-dependent enzyme
MSIITTLDELEAIYGKLSDVSDASIVKEIPYINDQYRAFIEASPFVSLATSGPEGLDCSPRGDAAGFVRVHDEHTLMLPDRHGNNRIDSLRNIVRDSRVGLLFLIPGSGNTLRINGTAKLSADPHLLDSFKMEGKAPRTVAIVHVETVYFQCARAIIRADLWNPASHVDPASLPTPGEILAGLSQNKVGGAAYDKEWPDRAKKSMW